jgi:hypothetical protein
LGRDLVLPEEEMTERFSPVSVDLPQRLREAAESLHLPPSIQSQKNIKVMNACDEAAREIERLRGVAQTLTETRYRVALEQIAARVPKKHPAHLRIVCPVCEWKSVEPHTEARHAPNCAGQLARAALADTSTVGNSK